MAAPRDDLRGVRVLVVGASSGIGRAVGTAAAARGAAVAFAARRHEHVQQAAQRAGNGAVGLECDVTDESSCRAVVEQSVTALGGLDAFVYAAGITPLTRLADATADDWQRVVATNLIGPGLVCAAALPHLRATGGRAVFLSSSSVGRPYPGLGVYAATKAGLEEQIRGWRAENADVCFSCVVVGPTAGTEFASAWDPQVLTDILEYWEQRGYDAGGEAIMPVGDMGEAIVDVLASRACLWHVRVQADVDHAPRGAMR